MTRENVGTQTNQHLLFEKITAEINNLVSHPARVEYANRGILRTLLRHLELDDDLVDTSAISFPPETEEEKAKSTVIQHYMALLSIRDALLQTEYYFRRFPFRDLPLTKTEHLRNCCEMYFDRIAQFRDRVKNITKAIQRVTGNKDARFGRIIKLLDKGLAWELKNRNATHHSRRFEDGAIDQLGLIDLLRLNEDLAKVLPDSSMIYRQEARRWVARVRKRAAELETVIEIVAGFVLELPMFAGQPHATASDPR